MSQFEAGEHLTDQSYVDADFAGETINDVTFTGCNFAGANLAVATARSCGTCIKDGCCGQMNLGPCAAEHSSRSGDSIIQDCVHIWQSLSAVEECKVPAPKLCKHGFD